MAPRKAAAPEARALPGKKAIGVNALIPLYQDTVFPDRSEENSELKVIYRKWSFAEARERPAGNKSGA